MSKRKLGIFLAAVWLLLVAGTESNAGDADGQTRARAGTVRCGGNQFPGGESHFSRYNLRNYSSDTPITIERLRFFNAKGSLVFDSQADGFPFFRNLVLGPTDNVLDPNQTANLFSEDVFDPDLFFAQDERPIQLEIWWSASRPVLTLEASVVTVVQGSTAQRSRDRYVCRTISLNRR